MGEASSDRKLGQTNDFHNELRIILQYSSTSLPIYWMRTKNYYRSIEWLETYIEMHLTGRYGDNFEDVAR